MRVERSNNAIAPVAGVMGLSLDECKPQRRVPVLQFHGTKDPIVPYQGGLPFKPDLGSQLVFRSIPETMEAWRKINECSDTKKLIYERGNVQCHEWEHCLDNVTTVRCKAKGDGHTWPNAFGGFPTPGTTRDIDASRSIINFFENHPMP